MANIKIDISSSTFTVPKGVKNIDVFCVGGGGSTSNIVLAGGAGGYTSTVLGVSVTPGQQLSVVVGSAGSANFNDRNSTGGTSSVGDICIAKGGYNGGCGAVFGLFNMQTWVGGFGGSGGGCGDGAGSFHFSGIGGKDGGDGSGGTWLNGKGQGTTTRYFGESTGTLYSTGGCGWSSNGAASGGWYNGNEAANTGNGASQPSGYDGVVGGSGIAIIRWGKQ